MAYKMKLKAEFLQRASKTIKKANIKNPSLVVMSGVEVGEYEALTLFIQNMKWALQGLQLTNQLKSKLDQAYYTYTGALVLYRQMFKGCSGMKRNLSKINLIDGKIRNRDGSIKLYNGAELDIKTDRFYIEEFLNHSDPNFQTHCDMIDQADKSLCHFDKESDKRAHGILLFDDQNPVSIFNHFEENLFNFNKLGLMTALCIKVIERAEKVKLKSVTTELFTSAKQTTLADYDEKYFLSTEDL